MRWADADVAAEGHHMHSGIDMVTQQQKIARTSKPRTKLGGRPIAVPVLAPRDIRRGHVRWGAEEGGGQRHDRPHRQHPNTAWYCASQSFRLRAAAPAGAVRLPSDRCRIARARRSPSAGMCKTGGMIPDRSDAIASKPLPVRAAHNTHTRLCHGHKFACCSRVVNSAACVTALAMSA